MFSAREPDHGRGGNSAGREPPRQHRPADPQPPQCVPSFRRPMGLPPPSPRHPVCVCGGGRGCMPHASAPVECYVASHGSWSAALPRGSVPIGWRSRFLGCAAAAADNPVTRPVKDAVQATLQRNQGALHARGHGRGGMAREGHGARWVAQGSRLPLAQLGPPPPHTHSKGAGGPVFSNLSCGPRSGESMPPRGCVFLPYPTLYVPPCRPRHREASADLERYAAPPSDRRPAFQMPLATAIFD